MRYPQLLYFRDQPDFVPLQDHDITNDIDIKIQPDDALFILVKTLEPEASEAYNLFPTTNVSTLSNSGNPTITGYLVDSKGYIDFPVLGPIQVGGLTVDEAKALLIEKLKPHLVNPVVNIRFLNFRVSVLGEVGGPRTLTVPGERITILEAIGQAGDLTPYSNRKNILVIREQNGKRDFGYVNLHSPEVFDSPYFYLQQNDIVYVEPVKQATAQVRDPISEILPIVSGILSIAALIFAFSR